MDEWLDGLPAAERLTMKKPLSLLYLQRDAHLICCCYLRTGSNMRAIFVLYAKKYCVSG